LLCTDKNEDGLFYVTLLIGELGEILYGCIFSKKENVQSAEKIFPPVLIVR
jgi:hypothetical protein